MAKRGFPTIGGGQPGGGDPLMGDSFRRSSAYVSNASGSGGGGVAGWPTAAGGDGPPLSLHSWKPPPKFFET